MSAAGKVRAAALALVLVASVQSRAAEPTLPRDGWVSWEVPAVEGAPAWCCFDGRRGSNGPAEACNLDERNFSFGSRGEDETTSTARIYARSTGGKLDRLQALSASCPVVTKSPAQELGNVSVEESVRWLAAQVKQGRMDGGSREPAESAMPALAMHRGDLARETLAGFARHDARFETRKKAVFWLAMMRGNEGADITSAVMLSDPNSEMRQHAAFALAQTKSPRVAADLIKLGNTDKVGEVRSKAWFWLAQTGVADAERAIGEAISKDPDGDVREEAVFALSQLPDERATRALIAAAENQSLTREQRKRAIFWLSQSRSDSALAYLDQVLAKLSLP